MAKLSVVEPCSGMLDAPKALLMDGDDTTVRVAFEVFPVPACIDVACTELFFTPAVMPCTVTDTVQLALDASVPADKLTELAPATAVAVPPQALLKFGVGATTRPAGKLSVNASPVRLTPLFGF
jgi:hypothetical protein